MVSNIIEEVKKGLTGDPLKDIQYLQEQAAKYKDSPDSAEILKILSDMSFELLPDESKAHLKNAMFIGEKRIDQVYNEINGLVKDNKLEDAEKLFSEIEKKADKYFSETEASKKFSFRNRLDEYIYTHIYKPNKSMRELLLTSVSIFHHMVICLLSSISLRRRLISLKRL